MSGALVRPIRAVAVVAATAAVLVAGAATGWAAEDATPPGPVRDLELTAASGAGARGISFEATWTPPAGSGDGTRYVVEARDALGSELLSDTTGDTSTDPIRADYCRAPLVLSVHAVTEGPDGRPVDGPTTTAEYGTENLCEINMSITAEPGEAGTLTVTAHREPPADPYVSGPCELTADGRAVWTGYCGGHQDRTIEADGLEPGTHDLTLTTVSPRGDAYEAHTTATVG
ncbi:hypothetical protein WIS52_00110 [Pseudonocardia nematodicida]|uniref:Fibronectin type-III domain-containing protein n=1 Tax=Pseudonocardia nematodicida TaxID=1206997 RepID=A0ABV1K5J5_9PSEU